MNNIDPILAIYSVNTNSYDDYKFDFSFGSFLENNPFFKYYLFTDKLNDLNNYPFIEQIEIKHNKHNNYSLMFLHKEIKITIPEGIEIDRFLKLNPIKVLPDHDISIYHDARIILFANIFSEIYKFKNDFDWISMKHRYRNCFNEELLICFAYKKINFTRFKKIKNFAAKENFNGKKNQISRLSENGFIVRKNNLKVKKISKLWTEISILTKRDQLSLPITLFKLKNKKINLKFFRDDFSNSKMLKLTKRITNNKIINNLRKYNFSIRYIFIYIVNFLFFSKT